MFETAKKKYRLGIDLGSTSLGWCMLELNSDNEPIDIIKMGVRIFPDGRDAKTKEPLSVARRGYRMQRRNLDRYLQRLKQLISYLMEHGFLSQDEAARKEVFSLNPYMLRAKGLDEELQPSEFARALVHMAKRRGFKSNRKLMSDKKTAYTVAIENLKKGFAESGARTLGEFLWVKYSETPEDKGHLRKPIKFRYEINSESPEPIFPLREMVVHEFEEIWEKQAQYSELFSNKHKEALKYIIFYQRPLKIPPKGKCELIPTEERAPKAHPLFQEFRIRQDLNNMKLIGNFDGKTTELSQQQYDLLFQNLSAKKEMSFESMRKLLFGKQADDYRFNFETENRKKLLGNLTNHEIHHKDNVAIAALWDTWDEEKQNQVIEIVISDLDDEPSKQLLMELGIAPDIADKLLNLHLPADFCKLSLKAMQLILPHMRQRLNFSDACQMENLNHSLEYDGRIFDEGDLPYYGELLQRESIALNRKTGDENADAFGRINNPTVHVALNQLRKVVNALSNIYGAPQEVVLELARDIKLGKAEKERYEKIASKNRKQNEKADELIESCDVISNSLNRLKAKLWLELGETELDRRCVYSGYQIGVTELFSSKIEIDHILPKSRTYDDSNSNKILCIREANRYKQERSPYEAFGDSRDGYNWEAITLRANTLPDNKRRRFQVDAMQRYEDKDELLARMLNDTRYMSRSAMKYMCYLCGNNKVHCVTGMHTSLLRGKWGLNSALGPEDAKNRCDHRHHAIDAFAIALTTRSMIKNMANNIEKSRDRFIENLDPPYQGFNHEQFEKQVNSILVSYKPDQINIGLLKNHKQTGGALLDETAYNLEGPDPENPKMNLYSVRKKISEIGPKNIDNIAAPELRRVINNILTGYPDDKEFKQHLVQWAANNNVKKVKVFISANPKSMIPVLSKDGKAFKYHASGENLFADIYIKDPKAAELKWDIEIVSSYHAHQPGFAPQWKQDYPKAKKVMRVFKNDIIAVDADDGTREFRRVKKMTKNTLFMREISIAKKDKSKEDLGEQFGKTQLLIRRARKAGIDEIGRAFDPIVNEV